MTGDKITAEEFKRLDELPIANKPNDYFTSALPAPQKGEEISLPIGTKATIKDLENLIITTEHQLDSSDKMLLLGILPNDSSKTAT